ncbi:MAG: deoxynucleoside kinase [Truepera sp.]|nr:deoxynucleoside kinase [Truepera sp.]
MYLAVSGNIGVGKSTIVSLLAQEYGLTPVYEAVDENPYLEDFYRDMPRYAFHSQMFFLAKRLKQHLELVNPGNRIIQDRTVYEDADVFARNLYDEGVMDRRDYGSYTLMVTAIKQALRPPDLLLYLRASLPTLRQRIALRGRSYESAISDGYLLRLNALYDHFIAQYDLSEVVVIDADDLDIVGRPGDRRRLLAMLAPYGLARPIFSYDAG